MVEQIIRPTGLIDPEVEVRPVKGQIDDLLHEIRARVERFFREWLSYFERMLGEAKEQGIVPANLNTAVTAQALLAYFEGVILLAKGRNDPALIHTLRSGTLSLMQYQGERREPIR